MGLNDVPLKPRTACAKGNPKEFSGRRGHVVGPANSGSAQGSSVRGMCLENFPNGGTRGHPDQAGQSLEGEGSRRQKHADQKDGQMDNGHELCLRIQSAAAKVFRIKQQGHHVMQLSRILVV
ncbi:hypothetical protein ATANTOWER_021134 [Ataeniobius toweri]|uniref:Uncharacterized protein n=1 Tax=Ataeniobius toweri TaxID=208326 RepID=A0ABU7ASR6_9TELE|nr:hypothetical protein [Ataeniobius toweri]